MRKEREGGGREGGGDGKNSGVDDSANSLQLLTLW